ncbi:iron complex outermembrane recepter protein [Pararobbsia alpina]|uniref:TonB-dependent siderophore receptor n=1 Tax=Pararobbsia alpina TaxID=621374 RepID=UPI0039A6EAE6
MPAHTRTQKTGTFQSTLLGQARAVRLVPIAMACAVASGAFAQTAGDATGTPAAPPETTLAPVVVNGQVSETATSPIDGYVARRSATGTKTDTPIVETPQSISVITADQMQAQAVQTVGQALRYTPGVIGEQYGGLDTTIDYFVVRGFPNQFPYIDGLSTETFFTLLAPAYDPYGLERIDVLRGPSSVLYGQNIPGGMINLVTKRPTEEPVHEASFGIGSYGDVDARVDIGGPLTHDGTLLYRFTGDASTTGSQQDFQTDKHVYLAPALTWKPSADTSFTLLSHFSYRNSSDPTVNLPSQGTLFEGPNGTRIGTNTFDGEPDFNSIRRTEEAIGYEFEHRFNDWLTVRQNLRYTHVKLDEEVVGNAGLEDDGQTIDRYGFAAEASSNIFTVDNQAEFHFDTGAFKHTALVGIDYVHSIDQWAENDATSVPSLNLYAPVYGAGPIVLGGVDYSVEHHVDQTGLYAQDQIKFGKLIGTFGVREDWARTSEFDRIAGLTDQNNDSSRFTYRAGLVYLSDTGLAPYVSYSTSFQPGLGNTFDGAALKPTTGQSVEVGVKYQPAGQKSFAMLSLYNTLEKNVVEPDFDHPDGNFVVQTGAQRVKGIELSGVADFGAGLSVTAAYTYMDGVVASSDQGFAGNQAPNVPHHMASLWADKTLQGGPLAGLGFGGGVRYLGPQYGDEANDVKMASTTLFDALVHYDIDHWRLSVNAQNLFDRVYANCQSTNYCSYGLRRSVIGRATYQW